MSVTLLRNRTLFDPRAGNLASDTSVLIVNDRIAEVSDQPIATQDATIVDLGGRTVLPGLIDCHVHVNAVRVSSGLAANPKGFRAMACGIDLKARDG